MTEQVLGDAPSLRESPAFALDPEAMTRDERSCLVYLETCVVDAGGLVEGVRMNTDDHAAVAKFKALDMLEFGRVPSFLLAEGRRMGAGVTHWVRFKDGAWSLAHHLRRRHYNPGPFANAVLADVEERALRDGEQSQGRLVTPNDPALAVSAQTEGEG